MSKQEPRSNGFMGKNALEWGAFLCGILMVLGFIVTLGFEAMKPDPPTLFEASVGKAYASQNHWLLPVSIKNSGSRGAAAVDVKGIAKDQEATATIEHLPGGAVGHVILGFDSRPVDPQVHVTGAELN